MDGELKWIPEHEIEKLEKWRLQLEKNLAHGQQLVVLTYDGGFIEKIRKAIIEHNIDLIIWSASLNRELINGKCFNYSKEIITRLNCPVLIIPTDFKCIEAKQVVLLSNLNSIHRDRATTTLSKFMKSTSAHLHILQLCKTTSALTQNQILNKSFLKSTLENVPHSFHFVVDKTMEEALQFFINMIKVDLVILFAKNINLAENILFSIPQNKNTDYNRNVPFLIIHE